MTQAQYNRLTNVDAEPATYARKRIEAGDLEALLAAYKVAYDLLTQVGECHNPDGVWDRVNAFLDTYPEPAGV